MILLVEGFDPYGGVVDLLTAGWTAIGSTNLSSGGNTPFNDGQSLHLGGPTVATYPWGSNESTVYGSVFFASFSPSSSTQYSYLALTDGGTNQVTIRWNMDGSISLYTGGPTGTLISTTTSVFTGGASGAFSSFQFKIVVSNTVGSIEIRVNGSPTNTITQTGVNTRGGTTNSYVNGLALANTASGTGVMDNLYLTTTGWTGEMRALQQRPTSAVASNFSHVPTTLAQATAGLGSSSNRSANTAYYTPFVATYSGTVSSLSFILGSSLTGNMKFAIYDSTGTGGAPGAALATSSAVSNPVNTGNTATFSSPPTLVSGTTYYLGFDQDATVNIRTIGPQTGYSSATTYASFPVNSPSATLAPTLSNMYATLIVATTDNAYSVQELIQDGDTSYIYTSSNVEDKYHLSPIATTYAVSAVQYYALWKKTDTGYRTASLSVDVGAGDTNIITTVPPTIGAYSYTIKTMELDPTGAAWTPTNVNNAVLGVTAGS